MIFQTCVKKKMLKKFTKKVVQYNYSKKINYNELFNKLEDNYKIIKKKINKPLTYSEKILYTHLVDNEQEITKDTYLRLNPDRVAMQDGTFLYLLTSKKHLRKLQFYNLCFQDYQILLFHPQFIVTI